MQLYQSWNCVGVDKLSNEVWQANFSPCGKFLAVSGRSDELRLYSVKIQQTSNRTSIKLRTIRTFAQEELGMDMIGQHIWSPDSAKLLVTDRDARGIVLDVKRGVVLAELDIMSDTQANFLSNDQIIATDHAGFVLIQESATGVYLTTHRKILDHTESSPLFNILSPDLNYIAMRINDIRISLLSAKFTEKDEISRNAIDQSRNDNNESEAEAPNMYTLSDCINIEVGGSIPGYCFSEDDKYLAVNVRELDVKNGGVKTEITTQLWDVNAMKKIGSWQTGVCVPAFLIFPIMVCGSTIIVSGSEEGAITFVHTQSDEVLHTFKAHEDLVNNVALHAEVDLLVSVSDTNEIKFWVPNDSNIDFTFADD
jgi:WD40 repeat protein